MKNIQQQFGMRSTPIDASQVCGSVVLSLNREETLSEQGVKTIPNNLDVNQHQRGGLNAVFVLNIDGKPLMPCKSAKARHLLRDSKANVVSRKPFTIRLLFDCENQTQPVTLGIDSAYKWVGFSARTEKKELISGELKLRTDIKKKLEERAMYRRGRRNKLWYREPRFDNRIKSKKDGWFAPSIIHKLDTHIRLVEKIKRLLPISKIVVEIASFDTQKMMNPEISGIEYQQGTLQGYEIREYLLEKFKRTCVYCGKTNIPLEVEHMNPKARGGSNRVCHLTISCHKCNQKKGTRTASEFGHPEVEKTGMVSLKETPFMNLVRSRIVDILGCDYTYGYITKHDRIKLGLEKSHINDAFVISKGTSEERCKSFNLKQTGRNNRCLQINRKGYKPSIRRVRYPLQPNDRIIYEGKVGIVKGVHSYGKRILLNIKNNNPKNIDIKKVHLLQYGKGLYFDIPPTVEVCGFPCEAIK